MSEPISYSLAGAAAATGLSVSHFDDAIRRGLLKAKTTKARNGDESTRNGKRVIPAGELQRYIASLEDVE